MPQKQNADVWQTDKEDVVLHTPKRGASMAQRAHGRLDDLYISIQTSASFKAPQALNALHPQAKRIGAFIG